MTSDFKFKRRFTPKSEPITIQFEEQTIEAFTGDTVAAALLANGINFTRTTPVSGAPRAPFCMMGTCFDCLVDINLVPNRQACTETVTPGMVIRRMHGARGSDLSESDPAESENDL